jgi:hypothetical protein
MRKTFTLALVGATVLLSGLVPRGARARGPAWQVFPNAPTTLSGSCPFDVELTCPVDNEYVKVLKFSGGSQLFLITGRLNCTFTNLSNGNAITSNVSGPGEFQANADGSSVATEKGTNIGPLLSAADAARLGLPALSFTAGGLTESYDTNGNITTVSLSGTITVDVCAALQ